MNTLYHKGLLKELEPFKLLYFTPTVSQGLMFRTKKVTVLNDFKGLKIRAPGGFMLPMLKAFGATPVSFPASEVYMALDRRVIDGLTTSPDSASQNKLHEVIKYWLDLPIYGGDQFVLMNLDLWNSLPSDIKVIIQELNAQAYYEKLDMNSLELINIMETVRKAGVTVYKIPPDEEEKWRMACEGLVQDYITQLEAKGLPGKEVIEIVRRINGRVSR
jgi:TRAP-type C4-dicarboxylate transport system substrate-binding protein